MCSMTNTLIYRVCCPFRVMGTTQVADMFMLDSLYPEFAEQTLNDRNLVAGSPVQERDVSRQARTSKRRINSRTPSPIPPPPKRRPQRSKKARALPARQSRLARRLSDCVSLYEPQVRLLSSRTSVAKPAQESLQEHQVQ